MTAAEFVAKVKTEKLPFTEVIAHIENNYTYTPTAFKNGETYNEANQNQGSAKVLYFAKINSLSVEDTLALFAEHYQNVLENPETNNHQNIRQFITNGWEGVNFERIALT